jgi:3-dehydroquinate synthase
MSVMRAVEGLPYPVVFSDDAPGDVTRLMAGLASNAFVVADEAVAARANEIAARLSEGGVEAGPVATIAGGEESKTWESVAAIHDALARRHAERSWIVVAVGGGMLTDVAGFAAATYMRGLRWLAVPTTPVGMADAAVGGKTAINHALGKNLIGAFWDPVAVVADVAALASVPRRSFADGIAEMAKAAIVGDSSLLEELANLPGVPDEPDRWVPLLARAAAVKAHIVAADPREQGRRAELNLGHTVGHALEKASAYRVSHGEAVALGLRAAGILAHPVTGFRLEEHRRVLAVWERHGLPVYDPAIDVETCLAAMQADKKRRDGSLRFVLPIRVGEVVSGHGISPQAVRGAVQMLRRPPRDGW